MLTSNTIVIPSRMAFIITICLLLWGIMPARSNAQTGFAPPISNLVFVSGGAESFILTLDGEQINPNPQTQVRVDGVVAGAHQVRMRIIRNGQVSVLNTTAFVEEFEEVYYRLQQNRKGKYALRIYNVVPLEVPPMGNFPPPPHNPHNSSNTNTGGTQNNNQTNVQVNPNININIGGTQNNQQGGNNNPPPGGNIPPPPNPLPGYNGPIGCPMPMATPDFQAAKRSIDSKNFEQTKLTVAKQIIGANCLLTRDIKEIMLLFTFETSRLEVAKYAYGYTYDLANYFMLNDAFTFESSVDELNRYIRSQRR